MKTKTEKGRVRICFRFLDPSLSKSLFLSHPPPPAAALNPSLTALNLSPSPRRNAVQSSAAAAPLLSSPRRTTPHRTHSFSSSRFRVSDTQTHQIAARKERQMETLKAALGIVSSEANELNAEGNDEEPDNEGKDVSFADAKHILKWHCKIP
ncbi:uncharacterized protein LOC123924140 isoform X2 [Trifolium pratense]|uniref:uncharacterized protein LOC123924140 isoform X2 n=1 Tax=Trifolium pratense TaxID=57577 RepID=UPI001E695CF6|nr:uncharacterized protein LOC123924140 isoform X2 [Trifolium pratense]